MKKICLVLILLALISVFGIAAKSYFLFCISVSAVIAGIYSYRQFNKENNKEGWLWILSGVVFLGLGLIFTLWSNLIIKLELYPLFYPSSESVVYLIYSILPFWLGGGVIGAGIKLLRATKS